MKRVLPIAAIPHELWHNSMLLMPGVLTDAYKSELDSRGLLAKAKAGTEKKDIHGGGSDDETLEHFAFRFAVSAGRVEFIALAPDEKFAEISDAFMSTFSEGHVALLDIPCGTGSCLAAVLSTLFSLRKSGVIPTQPLTISVMAGDCSSKALEVYQSTISRLFPLLESQAVSVQLKLQAWDATLGKDTACLLDNWFEMAAGAEEHVVCISNFNGALIGAGILDQFTPCLNQILSRLYDKKSTLLWVEPETKSAKTKLFPKIAEYLQKFIPWFASSAGVTSPMAASFLTKNPLNDFEHKSTVQVQKFNRT